MGSDIQRGGWMAWPAGFLGVKPIPHLCVSRELDGAARQWAWDWQDCGGFCELRVIQKRFTHTWLRERTGTCGRWVSNLHVRGRDSADCSCSRYWRVPEPKTCRATWRR